MEIEASSHSIFKRLKIKIMSINMELPKVGDICKGVYGEILSYLPNSTQTVSDYIKKRHISCKFQLEIRSKIIVKKCLIS